MIQTIERKVEGMTCGNCALTITNYLNKQGATESFANPTTGEIRFTIGDEEQVKKVLTGIEQLGYKIVSDEVVNEPASSYSKERIFFIISLCLWVPLIAHMFLKFHLLHNPWFQFILCTPVYLIGFFYFGSSALRSLRNGIPNMDVLVFTGSGAAYFYSLIGWYLYPEQVHQYLFFETTASIITLVLFGNFLEEYTVSSTSGAIRELMKFQKSKARLIVTDSLGKETIQEVDNKFIRVNDLLLVNTGDQIPADGDVISGQALLDESMMSGESSPVNKKPGDKVVGGSVNTEGSIRMKATAVGSNTALSAIIRMVNEAQSSKPPMQKLADKISAIFVPVVIGLAILAFGINFFLLEKGLQGSMMRSIAMMVIACPCAMGLATPAAVMVGLGRAARKGILIKGGETLEKFRTIKQFVFDKTGTLTTGKLIIDTFHSSIDTDKFRQVVAAIEQHSSHPIAQSISKAWISEEPVDLSQIKETKGVGMSAQIEHDVWKIGSYRLLEQSEGPRHDLYVLRNEQLIGWIDLKDELRPDAKEVISKLNTQGYTTIMLSGDRKEKCERIAADLGLAEVYSEKLPAQKMEILDALLRKAPVAMVGDGINDAPSLAKASIGISLSDASEIAQQSANVLLLHNKLSLMPLAIGLGKHTYLTIKQNLFWAFAYNVMAIPIAAAGYLTPTWGAGIMALSDVVLILNSLRLRFKKVD